MDDREEKEEVDQLLMWWNRQDSYNPFEICADDLRKQIFPLYTDVERLPSQNSVLARIQQKRAEYNARERSVEI